MHVRMEGRGGGGGGGLQLTGNLFLPFSLNKGCDWLHCVRTNPLHAGNKALKRLICSKVITTAGCHRVVNELDRHERSVLYYGSHSATCKCAQFRFLPSIHSYPIPKNKDKQAQMKRASAVEGDADSHTKYGEDLPSTIAQECKQTSLEM